MKNKKAPSYKTLFPEELNMPPQFLVPLDPPQYKKVCIEQRLNFFKRVIDDVTKILRFSDSPPPPLPQ